jgi:tetratricopeptide (TPR) repeat protein
MSLKDVRGLPVSTSNARSLERYERAANLTVSYFVDPLAAIDEALAEDPDFVMGHCLKAGLLIMSTEKGALALLADSVTALERLAPRANPRERAHAAAARAWLDGDFARSVRLYGDVLLDHPRDLLALQIAHVGDFLLGASQMLRDRVAQVLPHWSPEVAGFGYVLGMHAFGLEETALYRRAEETGRLALALNPRDPWAVHAVTHVMEMEGRPGEGIDWLTGTAGDWAQDNGLAGHNWWHLALFHLERRQPELALDIYDHKIHPRPSKVAYENVDASALLWRLQLRGAEVGPRWQALADDWAAAAEEGHYAFNDVHALLAFAGAGRLAEAERLIAGLERRRDGGGTNAMMAREVGVPLGRAILAFTRGAYDDAVELLREARPVAHRFGGSHAQRDIIHLTLVEAALRAGRMTLARALVAERVDLKPESPFNRLLAARAA